MDVQVIVSIGTYNLEVSAVGTDALCIPDTLAHVSEHLERAVKIPACKAAMNKVPTFSQDD